MALRRTRNRGRTVTAADGVLGAGVPTIKKPSSNAKPAASSWGAATTIPSAQATKASSTVKTTTATTTTTKAATGASKTTAKTGAWHQQQQTQTKARPAWDTGGGGWQTTATRTAWGAGVEEEEEEETESESESDWEAGQGGWGSGATTWGQRAPVTTPAWGQPPAAVASTSAAAAPARASAWRSWGEEAKRNSKVNNPIPVPSDAGSKNVLSTQQRSQIVNSIMSPQNIYVAQEKQAQQAKYVAQQQQSFPHLHRQSQAQANPKNQPVHSSWFTGAQQTKQKGQHQHQHQHHHKAQSDPWGGTSGAGREPYGWGPIPEEDEDDYEDARRVHFSPKPSAHMWGEGDKSPVWGGGKAGKAESINGYGWGVGKGGDTSWDTGKGDMGWGADHADTSWGASKGHAGWGSGKENADWDNGKGGGWGDGWGAKPTQGNNPWGALGEEKASQPNSPWEGSEGSNAWGLLERPKRKTPSMHSARPHDRRSGSSYSMPSKTFAHASHGMTIPLDTSRFTTNSILSDYADVQIQESRMEALEPVHKALFGRDRRAKERIHWMFPPDKDERVVNLLTWIQNASHSLGTFGVHKFLQTRERGALFANADFRFPNNVPAFDWLTFDQLQQSKDKILQESVVFYDPAEQVILFVCLPSSTGNSVAIWRRRIPVPNNTRLSLQAHINQALAGLRRDSDYLVHIDELPNAMPPITRSTSLPTGLPSAGLKQKKKKKRRWWRALFGL
ncbi:hypothetical protein AAF712_002147 [Marasmius tenuissimus]|uniref:CcmS related domain-containing protein n=1 Tax=Marasmius tenuissimus TaxID=585030 RepID=A0ABR3AAF1_9AGAR